MSEVNIPLLRKAVEWAEAEAAKPPEWTASGSKSSGASSPTRTPGTTATAATAYSRVRDRPTASPDTSARSPDSTRTPTRTIAADLLGIKYNGYGEEAGDRLFNACNSIEDVRRIAEDIAGERL